MATAGAIFFWTGVLSAFSALAAVRIASRIGLLNTAVFTHLPANLFLVLTPFMPTVELAVTCLLLRSALSQMDVPVRNSYVMAVVSPAERPAAASVTAVPREPRRGPESAALRLAAHPVRLWLAVGDRWGAERGLRRALAAHVQVGPPAGGSGAASGRDGETATGRVSYCLAPCNQLEAAWNE